MDIPELDMDDFMGYLTNDRELDPDESATLKSLFSDRLLGIDSPLPSMTLGGSRQGSALQAREPTLLSPARTQRKENLCMHLCIKSKQSECVPGLLGIGSPLSNMTAGGSRQGSALQAREVALPLPCGNSNRWTPWSILAGMWMHPSIVNYGGM